MSSDWFKKMRLGRSQSPHTASPQPGTSAPSSPQPSYSRPTTQSTGQHDSYMSTPSSSSTGIAPRTGMQSSQITQNRSGQAYASPPATPPLHQNPQTAPRQHAQPTSPEPPVTLNSASLLVKKFLTGMLYVADSDVFSPLTDEAAGFFKAWNTYQGKAEVQEGFINLASKLKALHAFAAECPEGEPIDANLQQRLDAIQLAFKQLTEAIVAKRDDSLLARVAQSLGDVAVVNAMLHRVSSLLEVFQSEDQGTASTLMLTIHLGTAEQEQLTNADVVGAMLQSMNQQHGSNGEQHDAVANRIERGASAGANERVVNNNANENYIEGDADVINNNSNENEIWGGDEGSSIVNNNPNYNYVYGSPSPSGSSSSGVRIENNNGNINRIYGGGFGGGSGFGGSGGFGGSPGGNPPGWPAHWPPFGGSGSPFSGHNSPFSGASSPSGGGPWPSGSIINNNGNKNFVRSPNGTPGWMPSPSSGRRLGD